MRPGGDTRPASSCGRALRVALIAALMAVVVAPVVVSPPASAAAVLTLEGRGHGHAHGMSQYGARSRAEAGQTYSQILAAYYPGTTLRTGYDSTTLRVRIVSDSDNQATVRHESGLRVRSSEGSLRLPSGVAGGTPTQWRLRLSSGQLVLEAKVAASWRAHGSTAIASLLSGHTYAEFVGADDTVQLLLGSTFREYAGWVRGIRPSGSSAILRSVVYTSMAQYLPSVVAAEMPTAWATDALRAQAVAARTYALHERANTAPGSYYDTCDTTSCQVFNGRADYAVGGAQLRIWTTASTTAAATGTWGRYLAYGGAPAFTQFSASNGGYSVAGSEPYLVAVRDPYDDYPAWQAVLSSARIEDAYPTIGRFTGVSTARDGRGSYGGRVTTIHVVGDRGSITVSGVEFRAAFGLRSTLFRTDVTGANPTSPRRDIVGDAGADILAVDATGSVHVWEGTGPARFAGRQEIGGGFRWFPVRTMVDDLAGSGRPEIVYVQGSTGYLVANAVGRTPMIGVRRVVDTRSWAGYDLIVGLQNWDGSGRPGLLARDAGTGNVYFFAGDGEGGLGDPRRIGSAWGDRPIIADVGDWDADGASDLVTTDEDGRLWLYRNDGSGGLLSRRLIGSSGWDNRVAIMGAGDWDRDGYPDFLSTSYSGQLWLHRSDGSGMQAGRELLYSGGWNVYPLLT